jgi:hypothetical protein
MKTSAFLVLPLCLLRFQSSSPIQGTTLEELERQAVDLKWNQRAPIRAGVVRLVESHELKTASDYRRAANLMGPAGFPPVFVLNYQDARVWYELDLTAFALGDPTAVEELPAAWDVLQMSIGKGQRFGTRLTPVQSIPGSITYPDLTSRSVLAIVANPIRARERAARTKGNPELQALEAADQADRTSKSVTADVRDQNDFDRVKRVCRMADAGKIVTFNDVENAFLVLQHGRGNGLNVRAHEMALCAALLVGNTDTSSKDFYLALASLALSYDRMLQTSGHLQRFGAQVQGRVDPDGICDAERDAMRVPPLNEQPKRG